MPEPYYKNPSEDFYVEYGICTSCGAPQAEAPDLIDHSPQLDGHCYFKKQPETDDEIERAINAISVACTSGLRYCGTNDKILKRLYEIGEGKQCDHQPLGNYKAVIWDKVTFRYEGSIKELSAFVTDKILLKQTYVNNHIINFKLQNDNYFEFIYRWATGRTGNIFKCYAIADKKFRVEIKQEENAYEISIRWNAMTFNSILRSDKNVSEIGWLDKDNNVYSATELR